MEKGPRSPFCIMKRNVAATAALPASRSNLPKRRSRNMKSTWQPKTADPEPTKARSFAEPFAGSFSGSAGLQWPPVEVRRGLRARTVDTTLPRCRSVKPHAVLGVNVTTGPRGSTGLRPRRPVPLPLSRVSSSHLVSVLQALGTDAPAVGTPVGTPVETLVTKIQSSDCSAFAAVDSRPSVIQGSEVSDVAEADAQLLQQNVKLHPVLGGFVRTRRRGSRCSCPCPCNRVPELLSLFPGGNCEN